MKLLPLLDRTLARRLLGAFALAAAVFASRGHAQLYSENFDDGVANNWLIATGGGTWAVTGTTDKVYESTSTAAGPEISYYNSTTYDTNYTYTAKVNTWGAGWNNQVGLVWYFKDTSNYYRIGLANVNDPSGKNLHLWERVGGSESEVASATFSLTSPITVTVERTGTTTVIKLNGTTYITRTQTALTGGGKIGVFDVNAGGKFNDVTITDHVPPTVAITAPADNASVSGNVTITASASDVGGSGLRGVQFKIDGANLGSEDTSSPYSITWNTTSYSNTQHVITAVATDNALNATTSAGIFANVNNLPTGWSAADIGSPGTPGSTSYNAGTGTFTLTGTGTNIFNASDQFHYASETYSGNFTMTIRVASVVSDAPWAKAGIMVRETSAANSRYVYLAMTPTNGLLFEGRLTAGANAVQWGTVGTIDPPQWLKLVRSGNAFSAYYSNNGSSWTQVSTAQTVTVGTSPMLGLAACTQVGGPPYQPCVATIDSLTIAAGTTAAFTPGITETEGTTTYTPTHYVDFVAGLETNSGTSSSAPWKYAPGMPGSTHTASAGNVIALKRGVRWPLTGVWTIGQSGSSGSPIIFTAYGTGTDLPHVTVLEDVSGSGWSLYGGTVYQRTVSGTVDRVYVDDLEAGEAFATTVGASENWVGQAHVNYTAEDPDGAATLYPSVGTRTQTTIVKNWKYLSGTLYLNSPSGNPNTNGKKIEALKNSVSSVVFIGNQSYITIDRLMLSGGSTAVINVNPTGTYAGTGLQITNCNLKSMEHEGIRVWVDSTAAQTNGVIKWNKVNSGQNEANKVSPDDVLWAYGNEPYPSGSSGLDNGITLYNGCQGWVIAQNEVQHFWHSQISILQRVLGKAGDKNNIVEHNDIHAERINYAHGMDVVCNTGSGTSDAQEMEKLDGNVLRYNNVHNTWTNCKHEGQNTKIYGNLIYKVGGSPRRWGDASGWTGQAFSMRGNGITTGGVFAYNTIVDAAGAGLEMVGNRGGMPDNVIVANNIIANCGWRRLSGGVVKGDAIQDRYSDTTGHRPDVDNNVLFYSTQTTIYERGTGGGSIVYHTIAQMETDETGWDGNIQSDPLFTNYAGGDLTLQSGSPARSARKDISAALPESATWTDIGAWQKP